MFCEELHNVQCTFTCIHVYSNFSNSFFGRKHKAWVLSNTNNFTYVSASYAKKIFELRYCRAKKRKKQAFCRGWDAKKEKCRTSSLLIVERYSLVSSMGLCGWIRWSWSRSWKLQNLRIPNFAIFKGTVYRAISATLPLTKAFRLIPLSARYISMGSAFTFPWRSIAKWTIVWSVLH